MTPKRIMRMATPSDANIIANLYLASRKEYIFFAPLAHTDAAIQQWMHDILIDFFGNSTESAKKSNKQRIWVC